MGSLTCLSSAPNLRCESLSRIQSELLIIPPALEVIFSVALVFAKWNSSGSKRHYLLSAEGVVYFALALLDLLAHIIPAVSHSVSIFNILDIFIGPPHPFFFVPHKLTFSFSGGFLRPTILLHPFSLLIRLGRTPPNPPRPLPINRQIPYNDIYTRHSHPQRNRILRWDLPSYDRRNDPRYRFHKFQRPDSLDILLSSHSSPPHSLPSHKLCSLLLPAHPRHHR